MNSDLEKRLDALDSSLQHLFREMEGYSESALHRRPSDGGWSPVQVLQHVMRAEMLSLRYLKKKMSYSPKLQRAGLLAQFRSRLLQFYLGLPIKFKAPANVDTEHLEEHAPFDEIVDQWWEIRRDLRAFLQNLPKDSFDKEVYRHPFAGRLSLKGMIDFFDSHFQRHRKQIRRTLSP